MLIQEALNELKLIKKRIKSNSEELARGAAWCSHAPTHPWSVEEGKAPSMDRAKVKAGGYLQSCDDLLRRYVELKTAIEYTNLVTQITVGDFTLTVAEALVMRREAEASSEGFARMQRNVFDSIQRCIQVAMKDVNSFNSEIGKSNLNLPKSELIYLVDPNFVVGEREAFEQFLSELDAKLQVVNATTHLVLPCDVVEVN